MRLAKAGEMRELDQEATRRYGIPGLILMENAGLSVVKAILSRFWHNEPRGRKALIIAGPGNNGGDGFVVARHLYNMGANVRIFLTSNPDLYKGDAAVNLRIISEMGIKYNIFKGETCQEFEHSARHSDLIVDAIFGTGFRGIPQEPFASLIRIVNDSGKPVVSVDLPSGLEADTGRAEGECIRARLTVTLGLPKIGLYLDPGSEYAGDVIVGDISFPPDLKSEEGGSFFLIEKEMIAQLLPVRLPTHHKGSYGHVVVIGGIPGYTGAVTLASYSALRSGAGLVTAVVPASVYPVVAVKLTEAMTRPAPEAGDGGFSPNALKKLQDLIDRATVLAVGPGLGQHRETGIFLQEILKSMDVPLVLDADALNLIARDKEILTDTVLKEYRKRWVLTPHPGEMARLLNLSVSAVQADRIGHALRASREWGTTVVLKGAHTIVALPDGRAYINPTGNPGLATGGTGDVLSGLIAGLIAQGLTPEDAALAGVFIHGWAGDRIAARKGMPGLVAGDLLEEIPLVLKDLYQTVEVKINAASCLGRN